MGTLNHLAGRSHLAHVLIVLLSLRRSLLSLLGIADLRDRSSSRNATNVKVFFSGVATGSFGPSAFFYMGWQVHARASAISDRITPRSEQIGQPSRIER